MKTSEVIFLGGLVFFAGILFVQSFSMPYSAAGSFGPGFVPRNMAGAVIVLALLLALDAFRKRGVETGAQGSTSGDPNAGGPAQPLAAPAAAGLIALALLAVSFGSLLMPLGLCMVTVTALLLHRDWMTAILSTVITLGVIYAIFDLWLNIPLN